MLIYVSQHQNTLPPPRPPLDSGLVTSNPSSRPQDIASPPECATSLVQTHVASARMRLLPPLVFLDLQALKVTPAEFARLEETFSFLFTLGAVRAKTTAGMPKVTRNGVSYKFTWTGGLLYRDCVVSSRPGKVGTGTLVLPSDYSQILLKVANESPLAGHFYHRKTE